MQLQSCGDDDPISSIACNWNDPFLCANKGDIRIKNKSTTRYINRIYLVENCNSSWGGGTAVSLAPDGSISYELDSEDKYDIKAVWEDGYCGYATRIEVPHGGENKVTLNRETPCNMSETSC